jgi:hypothetical protein
MLGKSRKSSTALRAVLLGSVALGLTAPAQAAGSADIEALERQMQILMQELQQLKADQNKQQEQIERQTDQIKAQDELIEQQQEEIEAQSQTVTPAPAQAVTGGDHPGTFKLPGSDTSIQIGGYVKGDLIYDVNEDLGDSFAASSIPADGSEADDREGVFRAHARQTRFNVTTFTPTDIGEIKTFIEGDFFGTGGNQVFSNSTSFRLRHAYGQVRGEDLEVLFGQTWTAFMPLSSYPDTVDFFGPQGIPFIRQGQLRASYTGVENMRFEVSVENSELSGTAEDGSSLGSERSSDVNFGIDSIPDFVATAEYNRDGWHFKVAGLLRRLEVDEDGDDATTGDPDDTETGWGLFGGAVIPTFGDDSLQLNVTYGEGVGRYLISGGGQDACLGADGKLDATEQLGIAAAYTRNWTPTVYSNVVYGHSEFDDDPCFDDAETFERLQTVHVNTFWQPVDNARFGLEYIWGKASFEDGDLDNTASRIQMGAQFFF